MVKQEFSKADIFTGERDWRTCLVCGADTTGSHTYCSEKCKKVARVIGRMYRWDNVRQKILERDDWTCKQCGKSIEDKYRELLKEEEDDTSISKVTRYFHVTHLVPVPEGGSPIGEENLIVLCASCNHKQEDPGIKEMRTIPITTYMDREHKQRTIRASMFEGEDNPRFNCPNCSRTLPWTETFRYGKRCECGYEVEIRAVAHHDNENVENLEPGEELREEMESDIEDLSEEVRERLEQVVEE